MAAITQLHLGACNLLEADDSHPYWNESRWGSSFWSDVTKQRIALELQFPGETTFYITSLENKRAQMVGGRVFEASIRNAAMRLAEGTHRLATPEEESQYTADARGRIKEATAIKARTQSDFGAGVRVRISHGQMFVSDLDGTPLAEKPTQTMKATAKKRLGILNRSRVWLHSLLWRSAVQDLEVAAYWRLTRRQQERLHRDIIAWAEGVRMFGGRDIPIRGANWNRFLNRLNPAKAVA